MGTLLLQRAGVKLLPVVMQPPPACFLLLPMGMLLLPARVTVILLPVRMLLLFAACSRFASVCMHAVLLPNEGRALPHAVQSELSTSQPRMRAAAVS